MHGHVTLISCSPEAAAIIASGGRISTMDGTADEIYAKSLAAGQEKNEKLIGKVLSSGHTSVLEHCYVNLSFENVSVLAEQFLIEFRLASFTVKSRRYVDFSGAGYVAPDFSDPAQAAAFDAAVRALFGIYDELEAAGVPKEDARFVLPYCFCSNFFCSMNARELVHVMNELTYGCGSGIPELRRTTRDEPDYDKLMRWRMDILREHGLGLKQIQDVIAQIDPLPGAKDFLDELRAQTQAIIVSDTFEEFAQPLMKKLGWPTILCNSLEIDRDGMLTGIKMRCEHSKLTTVRALQSIGYETIASGDSYNDLEMILASKAGFLFRSTDKIKADYPQLPAFETYDELLNGIKAAMA